MGTTFPVVTADVWDWDFNYWLNETHKTHQSSKIYDNLLTS